MPDDFFLSSSSSSSSFSFFPPFVPVVASFHRRSRKRRCAPKYIIDYTQFENFSRKIRWELYALLLLGFCGRKRAFSVIDLSAFPLLSIGMRDPMFSVLLGYRVLRQPATAAGRLLPGRPSQGPSPSFSSLLLRFH